MDLGGLGRYLEIRLFAGGVRRTCQNAEGFRGAMMILSFLVDPASCRRSVTASVGAGLADV